MASETRAFCRVLFRKPSYAKFVESAPHTKINEGPPQVSQSMVAKVQIKLYIATVKLQFKVSDITFSETFIVITNLRSPLIGLLLLQRKSKILDFGQEIVTFPSNQASETQFEVKLRFSQTRKHQPYYNCRHSWNMTKIFLFAHLFQKHKMINSWYISAFFRPTVYTQKKTIHNAKFSIITAQQRKHIKPVKPISVRCLLNNNHINGIFYINSFLKTFKSDEINRPQWFQTPQDLGNGREHNPTRTRSLNELRGLET